jgi:hypothetical protein
MHDLQKLQKLNIIEFIQHRDVLNDQSLSEAQTTILKSIYGRPLTDKELDLYRRATGRDIYEEMEIEEATVVAGRRGGKTTLSAFIVIFEAFRDHGLPQGQDGYVMLLAPTLKQAKIAFRYIRNYLRKSPILTKLIKKVTRDEIILENNVVIGCFPSNHDSVRGRTLIAVVCDEIAFWPYGDDAASPAEEVLAAVRPGMATVLSAKLIKISTPYGKSGIVWDEFSRRNELDFPVWQLTTFEMNPSIKPEKVERERRRDEDRYRREYLAEFTESVNSWISPEYINQCIVRGRLELPPQKEINYVAALDAATRGADFAIAIVHKTVGDSVVVDCVRTWTGTKNTPLSIEAVLFQIRDLLQTYNTNQVTGDQYYSDAICQQLLKLQIVYQRFDFTVQSRSGLFTNLKYYLGERKLELLDDPKLLGQLRSLRQEQRPGGHVDVRPSSGNDDSAVALALALNKAIIQEKALPFDVVFPDLRPSPESLGLIPEICGNAAICGNHPDCLDAGHCLGFKDTRPVTISNARICFT